MLMKTKALLLIAFVISARLAFAFTDVTYTAKTISDDMKRKADAVIRQYHTEFKIKSVSQATLSTKLVITVLNKEGQKFAAIYKDYDKQKKIVQITGSIYDENGTLIKKIKNKDLEDFSNYSNSLYQDTRAKYYQHPSNRFPYTVEYEVEETFDGLLFYPTWHPQVSPAVSIEQAEFTVSLPTNLSFRYKEINIEGEPQHLYDNAVQTYTWKINGIEAFVQEPFGPFFSDLTPTVYTAPNDFEFEGYPGNMETWNNLGKWINTLNSGRDILPETTRNDITRLVNDITDKEEITRKVYQYVQSKTRYVSVQLGIGGFQPFSAETVAQVGYGDCKALTNYTKALLKTVGIDAYYTLVRAGANRQPIRNDFPSLQFNHVILCVPIKEDTIWLECTDQENPFGFLGNYTGNRDVLVVNENGAQVARTPAYGRDQNNINRKIKIDLDESGNGHASSRTVFNGLKYDEVQWILRETTENQKKSIYARINIPSFELKSFAFSTEKNIIPSATEKLELVLKNYANVSGKRLFICPNLLNKNTFVPKSISERKTPILIPEPSIETDTVIYTIPDSLHPEFLPEAIQISTGFGTYEAQFQYEQGLIIYIRKMSVKKGVFPPETYEEFQRFYTEIKKADEIKLVLKKST